MTTRLDMGMFEEIDPPANVDPVLRRFGLFLRRKRHAAAESQRLLAYRTGVPQSSISRAERGLHPGLGLISIARILDELGALEQPEPRTRRIEFAWRLGTGQLTVPARDEDEGDGTASQSPS